MKSRIHLVTQPWFSITTDSVMIQLINTHIIEALTGFLSANWHSKSGWKDDPLAHLMMLAERARLMVECRFPLTIDGFAPNTPI